MYLVAYVGKEKEGLGQVSALINRFETEKILLIVNKEAENVPTNDKTEAIQIDATKDLLSLKEELKLKLKPKLSSEFEVALSLASGNGKEHMALLSALLSIPVGIKMTAFTKKGIEFLS